MTPIEAAILLGVAAAGAAAAAALGQRPEAEPVPVRADGRRPTSDPRKDRA